MKRLKLNFYCLFCLLYLLQWELQAQSAISASAVGHVTAEVIPVFAASETSQMNFGRFSPGPQGGRIVLTPEGTISVLGSVFTGTGTHNAASFYVTGDIDAAYSITLPESPIVLTHASTAKTMIIQDWISNPAPGTGAGMLQNGYQVVYVGATLKVGTLNDNPVGIYTGHYTITFEFN